MSRKSLNKAFGFAQFLFAQLPGIISAFTEYRLSIYQPAIYKGYEALLILPLFVGVAASWSITKYKGWAMWSLFVIFFVLLVVVVSIYSFMDVFSTLHVVNWALSYCVVAVLFAWIYGMCEGV